MKQRVAILGLGWLGLPLAKHLHKKGYSVKGSVSSLDKLELVGDLPFPTMRILLEPEGISGDWEAFIYNTDILYINIPPRRVDKIGTLYPQQIAQIISHTPRDKKVIFISSTSVYPNTNGPVDENMECLPEKPSGKAVLEAEKLLREHFGDRLTVLRMAGLIGPERHPGRFLASKRQLKNPNVPVNLIHLHDAIGLSEAVMEQECYGEIINGCCSEHPQREAFYKKAAREMNLPEPVFSGNDHPSWKTVDNTKSIMLLQYEYQVNDPALMFSKKHLPPIAIVGAGPGNPELLTVKALEAIKGAEILLHDNLVSAPALHLAKNAEHIYVGRKYGDNTNQAVRQQQINELMEKHQGEGKKVVRLKSGDPYVFGRAAEEVRFLKEKELPFEVIPGVSAGMAAASLFNLPITERHRSSSFLICTAHTADYSFEQLKGIAEMLKEGNSLAIYMGLKSLDKLIPRLLEVTGDEEIPINAVSDVSGENQKMISSTLGKIREDLEMNPLPMPVVFIAGVKPIKKEK